MSNFCKQDERLNFPVFVLLDWNSRWWKVLQSVTIWQYPSFISCHWTTAAQDGCWHG